jgi:hypothetical protein
MRDGIAKVGSISRYVRREALITPRTIAFYALSCDGISGRNLQLRLP